MKSIFLLFISLSSFAANQSLQTEYQQVQKRLEQASSPRNLADLIGLHQAKCVARTTLGYTSVDVVFLLGLFNLKNKGKAIAGVSFLILPQRYSGTSFNTFYFFGQSGPASLEKLTSQDIWDFVQGFFSGKNNNKNYTVTTRAGIYNNSYSSVLGYQSQNLRHFLTNNISIKQDSKGYLFVGQESHYNEGDVPDVLNFYCGQSQRLTTPSMIPQTYR